MLTSQTILKALDRPGKLRSILAAVDPGGREENLQGLLMQMRDRGQVRFDNKQAYMHRKHERFLDALIGPT